MLPQSIQRRSGKDPRLRVTTNTKENRIIARIVKVRIADLHIFNPGFYDCRISINLEVNLDRPDIDPNLAGSPSHSACSKARPVTP